MGYAFYTNSVCGVGRSAALVVVFFPMATAAIQVVRFMAMGEEVLIGADFIRKEGISYESLK